MSDNRPNIYWDDKIDKWVYRASTLGNCLSGLIRLRSGLTPAAPPKWMQQKFAEGNIHEPYIIDQLRQKGWTITRTGEDDGGQLEMELEVGEDCVVRCHPDGLGVGHSVNLLGDKRVVEVKALSPGYYETVRRMMPSFYQWQLAVEMICAQREDPECMGAVYGYGVKNEAGDEIDRVEVQMVNAPPFEEWEIKQRVLRVNRIAEEGPPWPECEYKQYPCGFYADPGCRGGERKADKPGGNLLDLVEGDREREVRYWTVEWKKATDLIEKYTPRKKEAGGKLVELFEGTGATVLEVGETKLELRTRKGAKGKVDVDKMVKDGKVEEKVAEEYRKADGKDSTFVQEVKNDDRG